MTQREKGRKRSSLAGLNPISSPVSEQAAQGVPEGLEEVSQPQEATTPLESPGTPKKAPEATPKSPKKKKVSFYLAPEEEARAKAAWQFTMGHTEHLTWTSFFEESVRRYTRELEAKYNDSIPFGKSTE